ncbi:MAG: class I SAM-dependent methyltransferase [Candidatus Sumerlaeia bacterium]|nr:class I SAM-dependent methyltransferase [Candidatus Sumerlaeia bacterium]
MLGDDLLAFAQEVAVQDRVAVEYEQKRYADPYSRRYHSWWTDQMLGLVRTDGRILDNGCGIGLLFEKIPPKQIVGLDLSSEMLAKAARLSDQLIQGNSQELPLKDNSFDLVFCRSLLHHLPQPERAVREMYRVLRPGGEMVSVDTNASILSALPRKLANRGRHFSEEHQNLTRRRLVQMLEPWFTIDHVRYFGYIAYPLLGFPDLMHIFRFIPFKSLAEALLMFIDEVLSRLPVIRTQSWGILIKATKTQGV